MMLLLWFAMLWGRSALASALDLVPPQNRWARVGEENVSLICKASQKIQACSWSTPYGSNIPLESGLSAEGGRLVHFFTTDKEKECGVMITSVQEKDNGRWRCNVGVVENSEVTTASGMANISIAVAPEEIFLAEPLDGPTANLSAGMLTEVNCVVKHARPAPTFTWEIDSKKVSGKTMDEEVFTDTTGVSTFRQTLFFTPKESHNNKTLRCIISHPGLTKDVSADVVILVDGESEAGEPEAGLSAGAIAGIIVGILLFKIMVALIAMLLMKNIPKKSDNGHVEAAVASSDGETAVDTVETPEITEEAFLPKANIPLGQKITSILARLKQKKGEEKRLDETLAEEFERVKLNEGVEEKKGEEAEKGEREQKQEKEPLAKASIKDRIRALFGKGKKPEDLEMAEKEEVETEKEQTEEAEEENKMEELEPEDKEPKEEVKTEGRPRLGSETPV